MALVPSGCVRSVFAVLLATVALAQAEPPPPPPPTPAAKAAPTARQRARWQPTQNLPADLWTDVTAATIGATDDWSNKVELADLDGDGRVDVLFANGGDYDKPGPATPSRVFRNVAEGPWPDLTQRVFGDATFFARVIKARDVDGDGRVDVFVGATFATQSRLYRGEADGSWRDATSSLPSLPSLPLSIGDAEFGDVDGDGDLDLVLADWGAGSPMRNDGARPRLWRNDGARGFTDVADAMPLWAVRFCWELELLDVDGDFDLDLLVSSKRSPGSFLAHNDGTGRFTDASARLPQFTNNYEFEPMDVDGDGVLDVVTINDGVGPQRFGEHLFLGDGSGGFRDATDANWPRADNPQFDDNMVAFLDFDSDGDADFLIGSLDGPDRLLVNDGKGRFQAGGPVFAGDPTNGTLGIALADLDGDGRLDVVHAQGEVKGAMADKVFFGKAIARDTAAPAIGALDVQGAAVGQPGRVRVRVHDRKSPCQPHDWRQVVLRVARADRSADVPMQWYGEYLWRAPFDTTVAGPVTLQVVATDAAGNTASSPPRTVELQ